jgi:hypothetical protein
MLPNTKNDFTKNRQKKSRQRVSNRHLWYFQTSFYNFETRFEHLSPPSLQLYVCSVPYTSYYQKKKAEKVGLPGNRSDDQPVLTVVVVEHFPTPLR